MHPLLLQIGSLRDESYTFPSFYGVWKPFKSSFVYTKLDGLDEKLKLSNSESSWIIFSRLSSKSDSYWRISLKALCTYVNCCIGDFPILWDSAVESVCVSAGVDTSVGACARQGVGASDGAGAGPGAGACVGFEVFLVTARTYILVTTLRLAGPVFLVSWF